MASSPRFISFRWKLWTPFLLVVLSVHWGLYSYFGQQFERQYERDQQVAFKSNLKALDGVLTTSYHKLLEVGQTILLMKKSVSNLPNEVPYQQFIHSSIIDKFSQFEAQGILDGAAVFDVQGRQVFSVGDINIQSTSGVLSALKREHPVREMQCDQQCFRTIAIPLLNSGELEGVLVLGRFMQDVVLDFKQLTAVDIGIARTHLEKPTDIEAWSLDFTQLTQRNRNIQILQTLSQQVAQISNEVLYRADVFDRHYEVYFTIPESVALKDTLWVLITDGTVRFQALRSLKQQLGLGLIISSMFSLMIAFLSALNVARRLTKVTLLAKELSLSKEQGITIKMSSGKHVDARNGTLLLHDEIADISFWVKGLGDKLDRLSESEHDANQRIESMANALRVEKEMVAHLVGNSKNIIVTQGMDGVVLTMNDVGKTLFDISRGEVLPSFSDIFFAGELNQKAVDGLNRIYIGLDSLVCSESQRLDLKGDLRHFSWIHSYIAECSEHRPIILSIGMDVTDKKVAERRLAWLVLHDPVTRIANKQFFLQQLPEVMEESLNNNHSLAVLCCDVKRLHDNCLLLDISGNDTALSTDVAERISNCLRSDDIVARFGDELFMVILKGVKTPSSVGGVAQKIITAFAAPFCSYESESIIDINIGISLFPDQAAGVAEIVSHAEIAMHMSRDLGVNRYQYYRLEKPAIKERLGSCIG